MTTATNNSVLIEVLLLNEGRRGLLIKQLTLVCLGIVVLILSAKIKIPMFPVPITMGTFAVLSIGAAYGPRLGLTTVIGYMLIGALGFDVFAGSSAEKLGITYMMGSTGGVFSWICPCCFRIGLGSPPRLGSLDTKNGRNYGCWKYNNICSWSSLVSGPLWLGSANFRMGANSILVWRPYKIVSRRTVIAKSMEICKQSRPA